MAIHIEADKCTGCSSCVDVCPVEALEVKEDKAHVTDACVDCGACVDACPAEALTLP